MPLMNRLLYELHFETAGDDKTDADGDGRWSVYSQFFYLKAFPNNAV